MELMVLTITVGDTVFTIQVSFVNSIGRRIPMSVFLLVCAAANIGAIFVPSTSGMASLNGIDQIYVQCILHEELELAS